MFRARWTDSAAAQYERLQDAAERIRRSRRKKGRPKPSRQEGLFKQVHKAIELLLNNPRHPGLRTRAYDSLESPFDPGAKVFEAYAQNRTPGAYRIFFCYGPGKREITIVAITPHP